MKLKDKARILFWDIETRSLVGDYGTIFTIGWKWQGQKQVNVKSIQDVPGAHPLDDGALLQWFVENVWNHADIAVGWYSGGHDEPYLRTRMIMDEQIAPKPVTTLDLWAKVWKRFKFSKNSLDNVSRQLGLTRKYYNPREDFVKVLYGDKAAMGRIKKHCRLDVVITEEAYDRFAPYVVTHPRVTHDNRACRTCGSRNLQRRGWKYSAAKGKQVQVWCRDCTSWDTKLPSELGLVVE